MLPPKTYAARSRYAISAPLIRCDAAVKMLPRYTPMMQAKTLSPYALRYALRAIYTRRAIRPRRARHAMPLPCYLHAGALRAYASHDYDAIAITHCRCAARARHAVDDYAADASCHYLLFHDGAPAAP